MPRLRAPIRHGHLHTLVTLLHTLLHHLAHFRVR